MEAGTVVKAPALRFTAVIMAGNRGADEPVARAAGKSHKCLVEVAGVPMLTRVLDTLESSPHVARMVVCVERSLQQIPAIEERIAAGTLERLDAAASPAKSALRACDTLAEGFPLLIVTADHPLLEPAMIEYFCTRAGGGGDVSVGVARADLVLERYPEATRTLLRFADGDYCGCNLFSLNTVAARNAVMFWTRLESERKRPWQLIRMLGAGSLLRYLRRRLSLADALASFSTKLRLEARAVEMPFAEVAIDVDKLSDLALVESILNARESGTTSNR
jgi:GTP:adenosylcobinamide-phosphate guanylyltransferase